MIIVIIIKTAITITITTTGWSSEEHLCLFELKFQNFLILRNPKIINTKILPGVLMKAVCYYYYCFYCCWFILIIVLF